MRQVRLINADSGQMVVPQVEVADTFVTRLRGLMGRKSMPANAGLLIEPCNGVHTCFMRFPIDVVYLDRDWRVIRVDQAMKPWRLGRPVRGARRVVELPAGQAARAGLNVGVTVKVVANDGQ